MKKSLLENKIKELFEVVKTDFFRPKISGPEISWDKSLESGKGTAFLNWLNLEIGVNASFVEMLSSKGKINGIIKGLFSHEFGHYFMHPRNLSLQLYLSYKAVKDFRGKADIVYGLFTDFQNNCLLVDNDLHSADVKELLRSVWNVSSKDPLNAAISMAYDKQIKLGSKIDSSRYDAKVKRAVDILGKLTITQKDDYGMQYGIMVCFADAILPLIGDISGYFPGAGKLIMPEDLENLPQDLKQKVEEALRKLIMNLSKEEYEEIEKYFLKVKEQEKKGIGNSSEAEKSAEKATVDYYRKLAKEYGIYVRPKRSLSHTLVDLQDGKKDFKPSDSPLSLDLSFSGGRIWPGLAKVAKKGMIRFLATREAVPRLLIYKDASGSMVDPNREKCYGTVAGAIFIMSYLRSNADVGVAIFDSSSSEVFYSQEEDALLEKLCSYKGGGTYVNIEQLKKDLAEKAVHIPVDNLDVEKIKRDPRLKKYLMKEARITGIEKLEGQQMTDFVIITDGGIFNLNELISFFKENKEYRPTIIHTGGYTLSVPGYDQKTSGMYEGIKIWRAESGEDIVKMAGKTLEDNLLARFQA